MHLIDTQAHMNKVLQLIEHHLPLEKWKFEESTRFLYSSIYPVIIYASKTCRVKFVYDIQSSRQGNHHLVVHYGTPMVPDNANILLSQSQVKDYSFLWHSVSYALDFLDGLSPKEAKAAKHPQLVREFEQSDAAKDKKYEPEKTLVMHAMIWETYGQRLFDIFDAHNKDLWARYSAFISGYWKALPQR